jgi:hypothetical protein
MTESGYISTGHLPPPTVVRESGAQVGDGDVGDHPAAADLTTRGSLAD